MFTPKILESTCKIPFSETRNHTLECPLIMASRETGFQHQWHKIVMEGDPSF